MACVTKLRLSWNKSRGDSAERVWFAENGGRHVMIRDHGKGIYGVYIREGDAGSFMAAPVGWRQFGNRRTAMEFAEVWLLKESFNMGPDEMSDPRESGS